MTFNLELNLHSQKLSCIKKEINWSTLSKSQKISITAKMSLISISCWPIFFIISAISQPFSALACIHRKKNLSQAIKVLNNGQSKKFEERKIINLDKKIDHLTSKIEKELKKIKNRSIINEFVKTPGGDTSKAFWNKFPKSFCEKNLPENVDKKLHIYQIKLSALVNLKDTYSQGSLEEKTSIIQNLALMSFAKNTFELERFKENLILMVPLLPVFYILNPSINIFHKFKNKAEFFKPLSSKYKYNDLITLHNELTTLDYIQPYFPVKKSF